MALIIKGRRQLFPSKKQNRLPITKNILKKIIDKKPLSISDLNMDTTFKVAWAGFMRMEKLIYIATEIKKATFVDIGLTLSDILFVKEDQYAILYFKRNNTNTEHN